MSTYDDSKISKGLKIFSHIPFFCFVFVAQSVVVSLGLYDALQKTEVSEFKKDITEMMERLAERYHFEKEK